MKKHACFTKESLYKKVLFKKKSFVDHYITVGKEIKSLARIYSERGGHYVNLVTLAEKH